MVVVTATGVLAWRMPTLRSSPPSPKIGTTRNASTGPPISRIALAAITSRLMRGFSTCAS